jgi:laccase
MKVGAKFTSEGIMFGFFFVLDNWVLVFKCACMDQFATTANSRMNPAFLSSSGTYRLKVKRGKTYLLRIINVSLLDEFLFAIADHTMTVVEVDGAYTKPYSTSVVVISPGQSMNVWVTADQPANRSYTILSASYIPNLLVATHRLNATGVFEYEGSSWTFNPPATSPTASPDSNTSRHHHQLQPLVTPSSFPAQNDSNFVDMFISQIKGIGADPKGSKSSNRVPLPLEIDRNLFFVLSVNALPCPSCTGGNIPGFRNAAAINNISFVLPTSTAILPAYYYSNKQNYADKDLQQHVYTTDFPDFPPLVYNYTGMPKNPLQYADANEGTKVSVLEYGSRVQIVLQSSSTLAGPETHPIHLHGQSFYVVATGLGNFDEASNVQMNLVDPPLRNTVVVPSGGWTVIRFVANNPGTYKNHTRNFECRCPVPLKSLLAAISMSLSVPADLDQSIV